MKLKLVFFIFALICRISADNLPEAFFGTWKLDHSDNLDAYLAACGYNWFARRLISLAGVTHIYSKTGPDTFSLDALTTKGDLHYTNVSLGQEFIGKRLDDSVWKITFTVRAGRVYERQVPADAEADQHEDVYVSKVEGDTIVQTLQAKGVVARRYYKKQ